MENSRKYLRDQSAVGYWARPARLSERSISAPSDIPLLSRAIDLCAIPQCTQALCGQKTLLKPPQEGCSYVNAE